MFEIPNIKFDKYGQVVGEYYDTCPMCGLKGNLTFQNKVKEWVCYRCRYK